MMHLHIGNGDHNVVYTGEMRFRDSILFTKPSFDFTRVETLIIESTYGNKEDVFPDYEIAIQRLVNSVNSTLSNKEVVLIPVPYIGLAQEISLILDKYIALGRIVEAKILVEKVIADVSSIHEVYSEYLSEEINSRTYQDEKSPFQSKHFTLVESHVLGNEPAIIICPLLTMDGEPLLHYLKQLSQRPESKIILASYQMPGSIGSYIQEGRRQILLGGREIQIHCMV